MIILDANGSHISFAMFDQIFAQSGEVDTIMSHPSQIQAYEETGNAKQEWLGSVDIPTSFASLVACAPAITIRGVRVHEDIKYERAAVGFLRGGEMIAQIANLALPKYN